MMATRGKKGLPAEPLSSLSSICPPIHSLALKRMTLEELAMKLEQIERQAALTLQEYPHGHTVERQRLIVAIARQVRTRLRDQLRYGERGPLVSDTQA
jgi:hypothetical protein